jgi:hypothetical protein
MHALGVLDNNDRISATYTWPIHIPTEYAWITTLSLALYDTNATETDLPMVSPDPPPGNRP